ncbi:MAG: sigma-70 family RNA polymerase sigma factor [Solirubrobacterales bacterium]
METFARNEATLRRVARRYSLCAEDAEDALQHALELLLRDAPSEDPRELLKWTQTVLKHKALAIRRDRERTLVDPALLASEPGCEDWVSLLPAEGDGPPERVERREAIARSREALQALKPQELRALTLLAEGYSYVEIEQITGFSQTKINRCLAEGRERFRKLISRSEAGQRCVELQPLISAFCDGQAQAEEVAELREHLRACAHCRATLRAYRAAPAAAAALAPTVPLDRSPWERAQDALGEWAGRFRGGDGNAVSQVAAGSGSGGMGIATFAKVAAVCIGTAGGAAACVATGLVPTPPAQHDQASRVQRHGGAVPAHEVTTPAEPEPAPAPEPVTVEPQPKPQHQQAPEETESVATEATAADSGAVEYAPPPLPEPGPAPTASESGSPAGEFGP